MALTRAGIPFLPINAEDIVEQAKNMDLLILPELAILSAEQAAALRDFAHRGGNILAVGHVGVMEPDGTVRNSSVLEDVLGVRFEEIEISAPHANVNWENQVLHNYLRIEQKQSPVFTGFDNTDILPMGGMLKKVVPGPGASVLATLIPAFPIYPPEFSWTADSHTDIPVLTEYSHAGGGKAVYAAWDLDSVYGRAANPDHGDLLGNIVRYLLNGHEPARVDCNAYIDFKFYCQDKRVIIHLINSNHTGFDHGYAEKNLPVGPVRVTLKLPGFSPAKAIATEDNQKPKLSVIEDGFLVELEYVGVHQLIIIE
jgi:hypothetical protein